MKTVTVDTNEEESSSKRHEEVVDITRFVYLIILLGRRLAEKNREGNRLRPLGSRQMSPHS